MRRSLFRTDLFKEREDYIWFPKKFIGDPHEHKALLEARELLFIVGAQPTLSRIAHNIFFTS